MTASRRPVRKTMKVLLLQDVRGVGQRNDIKEVNEGYARNFLIAKKLAVAASDSTVKSVQHDKAEKQQKEFANRKKYQDVADKLKSMEIAIITKVVENGKAFGSIGTAQIKKALDTQGIDIEEGWIDLKGSIKNSGVIAIPFKFPHGVSGSFNINIKPE